MDWKHRALAPVFLAVCVSAFSNSENARICPDGLVENRNILLSEPQYNQRRDRTLERYGAILREPFFDGYNALKHGDVFLDLGAGLGLATLEAAGGPRGIRAVAINFQDFWEPFAHAARSLSSLDLLFLGPEKEYPFSIHGIATDRWMRLAQALHLPEFPHPGFVDWSSTEERVRPWIESLVERRNHSIREKKYAYLVGSVEMLLPTLPFRSNLTTDVYGAWFYGVKRARLAKHVFKNLAVGATAVLMVDTVEEPTHDYVQYQGQEIFSLPEYLEKANPGTVSFLPAETRKPKRTYRFKNDRFEVRDRFRFLAEKLENDRVSLLVLHRTEEDQQLVIPEYDESQVVSWDVRSPGRTFPIRVRYKTSVLPR